MYLMTGAVKRFTALVVFGSCIAKISKKIYNVDSINSILIIVRRVWYGIKNRKDYRIT